MLWHNVCSIDELVMGSGVCAKVNRTQVALFSVPAKDTFDVYAIGNYDPIGGANVLSRGIIGSVGERLAVASPLYKQHFDLTTGECLEDTSVSVPVFAVKLHLGHVLVGAEPIKQGENE